MSTCTAGVSIVSTILGEMALTVTDVAFVSCVKWNVRLPILVLALAAAELHLQLFAFEVSAFQSSDSNKDTLIVPFRQIQCSRIRRSSKSCCFLVWFL